MTTQKKPYITPKVEKLEFAATEEILASGFDEIEEEVVEIINETNQNHGDVGRGKGKGGGCDGNPYHATPKTHSNAKHGC